jgi:3-dehydroquinate dehydratase-2
MRVGVLHGPNLNMLGRREPDVYGTVTLAEVDVRLADLGDELGVAVDTYQANAEGALVDWIQRTASSVDGYVVNAGGYTHTSVALLDALTGVARPYVEVHLSNLHAREPFRRRSMLAPRAAGVVMGFGPLSYELALRGLVGRLRAGVGG